MPYILECAHKVSYENYTMMRPLVFDFPNDEEALKQQTEYMFGPSLLICPVTEPGIKKMSVYLPEYEPGWVVFDQYGNDLSHGEMMVNGKAVPWSGRTILAGGRYHTVSVKENEIPVFIKADHKIKLNN